MMINAITGKIAAVTRLQRQYGITVGTRLAWELYRIGSGPTRAAESIRAPGVSQPIYLRPGTSDVKVFHQIFLREELDFVSGNSPATIVDAGANIGLSSLYLVNKFPDAKILSLEIESNNFAMLERNTLGYPSVKVLKKGLWSDRAWLEVANPSAANWEFRAAAGVESASAVQALGVHDVLADLKWDRIDLLKIDIEGGEVEVFSSNVEKWVERVGTIAVELHEGTHPGCTKLIYDVLQSFGFTAIIHGEYHVFTRVSG